MFLTFIQRCDRVDCQSGFKPGPSGTCVDVDECLTNPNACSEHEICENTMGSFECINQVSSMDRWIIVFVGKIIFNNILMLFDCKYN